jgi:tetratricopeptide (TPR) repeat protein
MSDLFADYQSDFEEAFRKNRVDVPPRIDIDVQPVRDAFKKGFALKEQSKWSEAAAQFVFCIKDYDRSLGQDHPLMIGARDQLADLYATMQRYEEAFSLWTICEACNVRINGPTNIVTLGTMEKLLDVLISLTRWREARVKGEALLRVLEETNKSQRFVLAVVLRLGAIYVNLSEYDLALEYHQRALTGLEKMVGFNNIETIHAQFKLGAVHAELGDMESAAKIYELNRDLCASTRGISNELFLRAAVSLGNVQLLGGYDIEAEKNLRSLLPATGPDRDHRYWEKYIARAANDLQRVYTRSGKHDNARKVQQWIAGDAKALLDIKDPKADQSVATTWSPRVGDEEEVSLGTCFHYNEPILTMPGIQLGCHGCQ